MTHHLAQTFLIVPVIEEQREERSPENRTGELLSAVITADADLSGSLSLSLSLSRKIMAIYYPED
jgi:hypothetical protein